MLFRSDGTYILELTHRADISRLAYMRGKTIMHLSGGGYNTLNKLANAEMYKMEADMIAYYESIGKSFADFKAVIPLDWMIGGAKVLPKIIEGEQKTSYRLIEVSKEEGETTSTTS